MRCTMLQARNRPEKERWAAPARCGHIKPTEEEIVYLKTLVVAASLVFAASAIAQQRTQNQTPPGNTPGHRMQNERHSTAPGASEFAPGHQKNTNAGPGHSESAPGQMRHKNTGMKDGRR